MSEPSIQDSMTITDKSKNNFSFFFRSVAIILLQVLKLDTSDVIISLICISGDEAP